MKRGQTGNYEVINTSGDKKSIHDRMLSNIRESRTLAALRGTLLTKLISGELRVPDAKEIVGRQR